MVAIKVLIFLLAFNSSFGSPHPNKIYYDIEKAEEYFEEFIREYWKEYSDEIEKANKFEIFKTKLIEINRLNEENPDVVYGITTFSDITSEDFRKHFKCNDMIELRSGDQCDRYTDDDFSTSSAPPSFDWSEQRKVTLVKNQFGCGSCWAFASTGAVESQYAIKHGELVSLSEQQLVDCTLFTSCKHGGNAMLAFNTLIDQGGQMLEQDYPYEARSENDTFECRFDRSKVFAHVKACSEYELNSVEAIKEALVQKGPLVVGLDGTAVEYFDHIKSGILDFCTKSEKCINHAVLLVGYGVEKGTPYWIIKNSWGSNWGEEGYFRMRIKGPECLGLVAVMGVEVY